MPPTHEASMLEGALWWAARGVPVLPLHAPRASGCSCGRDCKSPGKHPRLKGWTTEATTDETTIRGWWSSWPDANVGAYPWGAGLVAVDVDGSEGMAALIAWEEQHGALGRTLTLRTGGGGWHLLFRAPSGAEVGNRGGMLDHIDVRGVGGQIVVWPSVHASGQRYSIGDDTEPAPMPGHLLELIRGAEAPVERPARPCPVQGPPDPDRTLRRVRGILHSACERLRGLTDDRRGFAYRSARNIGGWVQPVTPLTYEEAMQELCQALRDSGSAHGRDAERHVGDGLDWGVQHPHPGLPPDDPDWEEWVERPPPVWPTGNRDEPDPEFDLKENGQSRASMRNAILMCEQAFAGQLRWNEFHLRMELLDGAVWRAVQDTDVTRAVVAIAERYGVEYSTAKLNEAMAVAAERASAHPVQQYLEGCTGTVGHPERWLITYCGAPNTELSVAYGRAWLTACVARVMEPGCKADCCLVMVGAQGAGKSRALRALAGAEWFSDATMDLRSKDSVLQLSGVWLYELAELEGLRRADSTLIKAFLSRSVDRCRMPYARHAMERPRQCCFAATTNEGVFLRDSTGSRRFWVVEVADQLDVAGLARDRDALWAAALRWYRDGVPWYLDRDMDHWREAEADQYTHTDEWAERVLEMVEAGWEAGVTIADILEDLGVETAHQARPVQMRVGQILADAGWRKVRGRRGGRRGYFWEPTDAK